MNKIHNYLSSSILFISSIILLSLAPPIIQNSYAQPALDNLRQIWWEGKYSSVLPQLLDYREQPNGRDAEVDYMIATSACRIPSYRHYSIKWFNKVLSYSLTSEDREIVNVEIGRCAASNVKPTNSTFITQRIGTSSVRGKSFYWLDKNNTAYSSPVKVIKEIPYVEYTKRLFRSYDSDSCINYLKNLLGSNLTTSSTEHFIMVSLSGHPKGNMSSIGNELEKVLRFFNSKYRIPIPEYLITIYLISNTKELSDLAQKLHGIKISNQAIGYSFQKDLSIIGLLQRDHVKIGTLSHELFHLMSHTHFGDIPPWMDEGMASLYEEARLKDSLVIGLNNWRGKVLKAFWDNRPALEELVKMNWDNFNAAEDDYKTDIQATNYATARYFMLYLQEINKLGELYNVFQERKVEEMGDDIHLDAIKLIELLLNKKVSDIDEDFSHWFNSLNIQI